MSPRTAGSDDRDRERRRREAAEIGARIREIRIERGMTQADVAGGRFSKAYISALENGIAFPSMPSLLHIASQLRVAPDALLTGPAPSGEIVARPATIRRAWFADGRVFVELDDGRAVGLPVARSARLSQASLRDLDAWEVVEFGRVLRWPSLGEEISIDDFLGLRVLESRRGGGARSRAPGRTARARVKHAGRYAKLTAWLAEQSAELTVPMATVEKVIGRPLPPSARRYTGPWYTQINPLARAIRAAGWRATVDRDGERVTFRRR